MEGDSPSFLGAALTRLDRERGRLREISGQTGIPYSTLAKISARAVTDPRVSTVQALHDYFAARPLPADVQCVSP